MVDTVLSLSKRLSELREYVTGKTFEVESEIFKEIESVKIKLRLLSNKN